jgi:hypothetical protein
MTVVALIVVMVRLRSKAVATNTRPVIITQASAMFSLYAVGLPVHITVINYITMKLEVMTSDSCDVM